ncbi:hypothetical protein MAE02_23330 [Microvirga aerophila]|uniref:Uncharacterized protein n=1 Tax=Microvirga aerophila TaxID=670291 RepID=A0A512BS42_9HYPH|nr:hypothetical protein MAE02_23330 [Microvirga aerophila]
MRRAPQTRSRRGQAELQGTQPSTAPLTVASLGMRVRLIRADQDRDRQLADLIASCETLRAQWELLFRRIIDCLDDDDRKGRGRNDSSSQSNS